MVNPRYLTKSRFKLAVECPTKLFYTGKGSLYRNTKSEDSFLQALADGGFQVGKMATMLFPEGIEVTETSNAQALARTQALLSQHTNITLFEAAVAFEGFLVRVDILVKRGHSIDLIEVKAKSFNSEDPQISGARTRILSDMLPYIQDIAFQKHVVSLAYPQASIRCFLMMPDKAVTAAVNGLNQCFKIRRSQAPGQAHPSTEVLLSAQAESHVQACSQLLAKVPVDEYVEHVLTSPLDYPGARPGAQSSLAEMAIHWAQAYASDTKLAPVAHSGCTGCEFREPTGGPLLSGYHECLSQSMGLTRSQIDAGTVLDIWNFRQKDKLLAQGVYQFHQVTGDDIKVKNDREGLSYSQRQWMQVKGIPPEDDRGGFYFNAEYFNDQRRNWRYPLHMIDFETCTVALPFFKGMRPYESVAFQFSHHVVQADGSIQHRTQALIAAPGEFPNYAFVRALRKALGHDNGTIFRWAPHENTILTHIRDQLLERQDCEDAAELIEFIERITTGGPRDMVDLRKIALAAYFHPQTKGSTSIKAVLPAVLQTSERLRTKYARPIYGTLIPSLNFTEGIAWGLDPYAQLKGLDHQEVAEGGAAAMAYARLQFEDLQPTERSRIEQSLLRYCELDSMAMVMILEAWQEWAE